MVLKNDYEPIFKVDVSSVFNEKMAMDGSLRIVRAVKELSHSISTHDLIGKVFHELIPLDFRKLVAAYYTNSAAGDLLAGLAIDRYDEKILDPACGSGTLLVSSYKRKSNLAPKSMEPKQLHFQFVQNDITGIDAMAFSAHLAAIHLILQAPSEITESLKIGTIDSTYAKIGLKVPTFGEALKVAYRQRKLSQFEGKDHIISREELTSSGAISLGRQKGEGFELSEVNTVIMNPPFTSSRRLSLDYKDELKIRFRCNSRYKNIITGNVRYQVYFICIADKLLEPNGRIAAVLPFTTLVGGDYSELTKFLVKNYSIEYIIVGKGRSAFSENTDFSEILFIAKKKLPKQEKSLLIQTKLNPLSWTQDNINSMIKLIKETKENPKIIETKLIKIIPFEQKDLLHSNKMLTGLVQDFEKGYKKIDKELVNELASSKKITKFSDLEDRGILKIKVAEVVHGKAGDWEGHSLTRFGGDALILCRLKERSIKKHDRLIFKKFTSKGIVFYDKMTNDEYSIPKKFVMPALRRFPNIKTIDITNKEDFIINDYHDILEKIYSSIYGEKKTKSYLKDIKEEWGRVIKSGTTTLSIPGRIDLNGRGSNLLCLRSDNQFLMCSFMWEISKLNKINEKIISLWVNSSLFMHFLLSHKTVTRGSWVKIHSKQLVKMPVIDLEKINYKEREELLTIYNKLRRYEWSYIYDQYSNPPKERIMIDSEFLKILGMNKNDIEKLLLNLYKSIYENLESMRKTMDAD